MLTSFLVSWLDLTLILLLSSKFYYLWGFSTWPQPAAPTVLILLRDVICWGTLGFWAWQARNHLGLRSNRIFACIFGLGLLISLFHLYESKSFYEWAQHYLRNTLLPMLFYPVGLAAFQRQKTIQISKVIAVTAILNIIASLLQMQFFPQLMWGDVRPTGLIGDPLILSLLILFGCFSFFAFAWWFAVPMLAISAFVLVFSSSLSALVSFVFALFGVGVIFAKSQKVSWKKVGQAAALSMGGFVLLFAIGFMADTKLGNQKDLLIPKTLSLLNSAICEGESCQRHWSYQGRIQSNQLALELCSKSFQECFLGDFKRAEIQKVDSALASLILNWGLLFAFVAIVWVFWHFKILWNSASSLDSAQAYLWALIFFSCLLFSLFNSVMYKYPLNILFYLSLAFIQSLRARREDPSTFKAL